MNSLQQKLKENSRKKTFEKLSLNCTDSSKNGERKVFVINYGKKKALGAQLTAKIKKKKSHCNKL